MWRIGAQSWRSASSSNASQIEISFMKNYLRSHNWRESSLSYSFTCLAALQTLGRYTLCGAGANHCFYGVKRLAEPFYSH